MPRPLPAETVRLMFEARAAGDLQRFASFLHPELVARTIAGRVVRGRDGVRAYLAAEQNGGRRTEVHAHRIVEDGDGVVAYGRIRTVDGGSLADSPAAWRFEVLDGMVVSIAPVSR